MNSHQRLQAFRGDQVVRVPLGDQIALAIRADILLGRLKPGEHLSQQQICERFGTSRIPVRDAFNALLHEGFVTEAVGHRVVVARSTRQDLSDIYMIEGLLHGIAARRAAEHITVDELEELRALHRQFKSAVESNQEEDIAALNWEFHRRLNQMADSPRLLAALRPLATCIPRDIVSVLPRFGVKAVTAQRQMLQALKVGDGEVAERIMVGYVNEAGADLIEYLDGQRVTSESG